MAAGTGLFLFARSVRTVRAAALRRRGPDSRRRDRGSPNGGGHRRLALRTPATRRLRRRAGARARASVRSGSACPDRAGRPRLSATAGGAHPRALGAREASVLSVTPAVSLDALMSSRLPTSAAASEPGRAQADSDAWLNALRATGPERAGAVDRLHQLLEGGVRLRRRAWQEREVVLAPEAWPLIADTSQSPQSEAESGELMQAISQAIHSCLTEHQREVLVALALNGVPIDVLTERLGTTRGALYKTLHDARQKLRADLVKRGFTLDSI